MILNSNLATTLLIGIIFCVSLAFDLSINQNYFSIILFGSTVISYVIGNWGVNKLNKLKFRQIIRDEGPKAHYLKAGTPTMGGIFIVPAGLFLANIINISDENYKFILAISCITLAYMLIGSLDDWQSLKNQTNKGLSAQSKLILQSFAGIIFLLWAYINGGINTSINMPLNNSIDIGVMIWPLALFVFLAESNATNLTDGLDGLASGIGAIVFTGMAIELILNGKNETDPIFASFCIAMAGTWLGFLINNKKPARLFMGDTGSLAMGASLSGVALLTNQLWTLLIMGGIFLIESLSVIFQVWYFKITKKINGEGQRLFLMAPLHHHYELAGIKEESIVQCFWVITTILVLLGILLSPH